MIKHEETGMVEATVTINGRALSFAQSMTLRVAVGSFRISLSDPAYARAVGLDLAAAYDLHLQAIESAMRGDASMRAGDYL
jgi:hypothetical protein